MITRQFVLITRLFFATVLEEQALRILAFAKIAKFITDIGEIYIFFVPCQRGHIMFISLILNLIKLEFLSTLLVFF